MGNFDFCEGTEMLFSPRYTTLLLLLAMHIVLRISQVPHHHLL